MSVEEPVLFVTVIVLALALVVAVVGPKLRAGRPRPGERDTKDAPDAKAEKAPEAGVAAVRATPPVEGAVELVEDGPVALPEPPVAWGRRPPPTPPQAWGPLVCPTCRRQFSAGLRFCPYDARLLTADPPAGQPGGERESTTDPNLMVPTGKICPTCARRYEMVAVVCARDGAPLVSVN